jgi:DNA-binding response OmpR family regulator
MFKTRPYALVIDRDEEIRGRMTALLRESGFVVAAFRESRGALAALVARSVDIAIVAGQLAGGEDAVAMARQIRHCRPGCKVLFTGGAEALPAVPGADSGETVTRPFDKRRFLSAVFGLLAEDSDEAELTNEAELALATARLTCLNSREMSLAAATDVLQRPAPQRVFDAPPEAA